MSFLLEIMEDLSSFLKTGGGASRLPGRYHFQASGQTLSFADLPDLEPYYFNKAVSDFMELLLFIANFSEAVRHERPDLLLFGDSVLSFTDPKEADRRLLRTLLADKIGGQVFSFDYGAVSARLYEKFFQTLPPDRPGQMVLVEFNLRSLSDEWFLRPSYAFSHFVAAIDCRLDRRRLPDGLKTYFEARFTDGLYLETTRFHERVLKNTQTRHRRRLGPNNDFHYCLPEEQVAPRLSGFLRALETLKAAAYVPLVYLTPINHQGLEPTNRPLFHQNIRAITDLLQRNSIRVLDLSSAFTEDSFIGAEHLCFAARLAVAEKISRWLTESGLGPQKAQPEGRWLFPPAGAPVTPAEMDSARLICAKLD